MKLTTALLAAGVALAGVTATPVHADDGLLRFLTPFVHELDRAARGVDRGRDDGRGRIWRVDDDDDGWGRRGGGRGWDDDDDDGRGRRGASRGWDDDDDDGRGRRGRGRDDDDDDDGRDDDDD